MGLRRKMKFGAIKLLFVVVYPVMLAMVYPILALMWVVVGVALSGILIFGLGWDAGRIHLWWVWYYFLAVVALWTLYQVRKRSRVLRR